MQRLNRSFRSIINLFLRACPTVVHVALEVGVTLVTGRRKEKAFAVASTAPFSDALRALK